MSTKNTGQSLFCFRITLFDLLIKYIVEMDFPLEVQLLGQFDYIRRLVLH